MREQPRKRDFLSLFRKEAEMHMQELNKGLLKLESDPQDREALEEVRRCAHTLNGSARIMGFTEISNAARAMEDLVESVITGSAQPDRSVLDNLSQSLHSIRALLEKEMKTE